ncbi:MAG: ATP-binding protein [Bacilli bacterium]
MEKYTYKIISNDLENAGCIASRVKKMLIQKGIDRQTIRRVAIASYEAEINVVIHSYGGICNVIIDGNELTLEYIDDGPGIACIADAMKEGWSTASKVDNENGFGAGMGFPNMKNASDKLDVKSSPDGTRVVIHIKIR